MKQITVSAVLALLDEGKSRKEIAEHFGISQKQCKEVVFQHPKLKGKKAKQQLTFELVDDTEEIPVAQEPIAENNDTVTGNGIHEEADETATMEQAPEQAIEENATSEWQN